MNQSPQLILNVGVTGHRLNKIDPGEVMRVGHEVGRLLAKLRTTIDEFSKNAGASLATAPRLQIISPLAEGADRIVAHAALDLGADVIVLLPFGREEYTHDFLTRESRAEFQALIDNATEVVELDGQRDTEKSKKLAYTKVGAVVIERCDILFALWDGRPASGIGGTAEVVDLAKRRRCPIVWLPVSQTLPSAESQTPRLLVGDDTTESGVQAAVSQIAKNVLMRQL